MPKITQLTTTNPTIGKIMIRLFNKASMTKLISILFCLAINITSAYSYNEKQNNHNPFSFENTQTNNATQNNETLIKNTKLQPFHCLHISCDHLLEMIKQKNSPWVSSSAKISSDKNTQLIWVQDDTSHLNKISSLLKAIDHTQQQIRIKAEVISLSHKTGESLGVQFNSGKTGGPSKINSGANTFLVPLFKLTNNVQLNMQLQALMQHGKAKLLANPDLLTLNLQPATIESGQEIPYQQATTSGATSVTFKEAALKLQVTPQILPNNDIKLQLQLNQDTVSGLTIAGVPAISTQQLQTSIVVHNKETAALGGILTSEISQQHSGVPILNKLPIIGVLFREHHTSNQKDELMILITPEIQ